MGKDTKDTSWHAAFVEEVRTLGSVTKAIPAQKMSWATWEKAAANFPDLRKAVDAARYEFLDKLVPKIEDRLYTLAMAGNFKAIMAILTNRRPDKWKSIYRQEIVSPDGSMAGPININLIEGVRPIEEGKKLVADLLKERQLGGLGITPKADGISQAP